MSNPDRLPGCGDGGLYGKLRSDARGNSRCRGQGLRRPAAQYLRRRPGPLRCRCAGVPAEKAFTLTLTQRGKESSSIPRRSVDHFLERIAAQEAAEIVDEEA